MAYAGGPRRPEIPGGLYENESQYERGTTVDGDVVDGHVQDVVDANGNERYGWESSGDFRGREDVAEVTTSETTGGGTGGEGGPNQDDRWNGWPPGPDDRAAWALQPPGAQPALRREGDGPAYWLGTAYASIDDRLRTLGNGVVPAQAAAALRILLDRTEN